MTTATHTMNNGFDTWIFAITGDQATVEKVNDAGVITTERKITTREQARKFWADGFRLASMMRQGSVIPATCTIHPEYAYCEDEADEPMPFGVR
jgi:hypothetical protein